MGNKRVFSIGKYCEDVALSFPQDEYSRKKRLAINLVMTHPYDLDTIIDNSRDEELNQLIREACKIC